MWRNNFLSSLQHQPLCNSRQLKQFTSRACFLSFSSSHLVNCSRCSERHTGLKIGNCVADFDTLTSHRPVKRPCLILKWLLQKDEQEARSVSVSVEAESHLKTSFDVQQTETDSSDAARVEPTIDLPKDTTSASPPPDIRQTVSCVM